MPLVEIRGLRFHYQQKGHGPDIILLHPITGNLSIWLFGDLMGKLAQEFRVTAYDFRGHGGSAVPESGYSSADMAEDLRNIHRALGLGPALLVGHSFGGVVALHAAVLYADMVCGVILCDAFIPGLAHIEPNLADAPVWRELRAAFAAAGIDLGERVDFARLFRAASALTSEQRARLRDRMGDAWMRWVSQLSRLAPTSCGTDMFAPAGLTPQRIREVRQPVIALYDEHTSFAATCAFLVANLPHARAEIVPGAKHLAPVQSSSALIELLRKHARALAGQHVH